jgi:hypothetical protein
MRAKLFVELEVEVGSRLVFDSAAQQPRGNRSASPQRKLANRWPATVGGHGWLSVIEP